MRAYENTDNTEKKKKKEKNKMIDKNKLSTTINRISLSQEQL